MNNKAEAWDGATEATLSVGDAGGLLGGSLGGSAGGWGLYRTEHQTPARGG